MPQPVPQSVTTDLQRPRRALLPRRTRWLLPLLLLAAAPWSQAAGLRALQLLANGGVSLEPAFSAGTTRYRARVQSDIASLDIAAQTDDAAAALRLSVNGQDADARTPLRAALQVGANTVQLRVSQPGQPDQLTTVEVERQDIAPVIDRFQRARFTDPATGAQMPYRLLRPTQAAAGPSPGPRFPLVVFLHGGGERGDDNDKPLAANQGGTVWALPEEQALRPAFVLVPQARSRWDGGFGVTRNPDNQIALGRVFTLADDVKTAHALLQQLLADEPAIDPKRLYVVGLSQGGFGAWNWNLAYPQLFAGVVAVCGGADPAQVARLKDKPLWAFHAAADPVIPVDYSRNAVAALRAAGGNPRYTEYPAGDFFFPMAHFSWVPAFATREMREWLFAQRLP